MSFSRTPDSSVNTDPQFNRQQRNRSHQRLRASQPLNAWGQRAEGEPKGVQVQ